jgi:hypothetical protein
MSFHYLQDKIASASVETEPFRHIYIKDLFNEDDFAEIVSAPEILFPSARSDEQLFDTLFAKNYEIIEFPGCITNRHLYMKWHGDRNSTRMMNNTACEGFGMTLRLGRPTSSIIGKVFEFMVTDQFQQVLADKFGIERQRVTYDGGIQKYLDGYEISPHPDIRSKALTYMVNVNPGPQSERRDHHTHYLRFRDEYKYLETYWDGHPNEERCWVPWNWCKTEKEQRDNNTMVIFSPANSTLHAVRARYNHLAHQRTQMYGNLWYKDVKLDNIPRWEDYVIGAHPRSRSISIREHVKAVIPANVKQLIRRVRHDDHVVKDRLKQIGLN